MKIQSYQSIILEIYSSKKVFFLHQVPSGIQHSWSFEALELRLSHNNFKRLRPESFPSFPKLRVLILSNNTIRSIAPGTFTGTRNVRQLLLDHNKLRSMNHTGKTTRLLSLRSEFLAKLQQLLSVTPF